MTRWTRFALVLAAGASLWPGCGPDAGSVTPFTPISAGPPASTLAQAPPTASLSGIWVGNRPADGMVLSFSGCGACAGAPSSSAADVALNISDSSHALSGSATLTVREASTVGCPAQPECSHGPVGEVTAAGVIGSVGVGGRVTMQWTASMRNGGPDPMPVLFTLEGTVSANRMSGAVILAGAGVPGGRADGTWSVDLQQAQSRDGHSFESRSFGRTRPAAPSSLQ